MSSEMLSLLNRLEQVHTLSCEEWERLIAGRTPEVAKEAAAHARVLRDARYGTNVYTRGLIEFTNYCKNDCLYCGIRKSNSHANRYRLSKEEILECCKQGHELGFAPSCCKAGKIRTTTTNAWWPSFRKFMPRTPIAP